LSTEPTLIHENLILTGLQGDDVAEVLAQMADALMKNGNVKDGFAKAVTEREEGQPTGLPTASVGIAIPHADPEYVLQPAICVGFPERLVTFRMMGEEEETVEVGIIFMLAINKSEQQLDLFERLMDFIGQETLLTELLDCNSSRGAADLLIYHLQNTEKAGGWND
jgi:PTS system galactitol-specific IIA component